MKESLILVNWTTERMTNDDIGQWLELDYNDVSDEVINITITGIGEVIREFISQSGYDIFTDDDLMAIKAYIKSLLEPNYCEKDLMKSLHWRRPTYGEFIVVMEIHGFKSNHPLDPEEWDVDLDYIGILGEGVKLSY